MAMRTFDGTVALRERESVETSTLRLSELCEKAPHWRLPSFQRHYVWDETHRASLVESILAGVPMGTITLWSPVWRSGPTFVLDGQQRLTTLVRFLDSKDTIPSWNPAVAFDDITVHLWALCTPQGQMFLFDICRKLDRWDGTMRAIARTFDIVSRYSVNVVHLVGDEKFARETYARMNSTGVPVNLDDHRLTGDITVADVVAQVMRASACR